MNYTIRPARPDDLAFVMDSWLNKWRVSKYAGVVRNHNIYDETRGLIEDLLARGMKILVADEGRTLLGFIAYEVDRKGLCVVHWLHVKDAYLRYPVADRLLDSCEGTKPGLFSFYNRTLDKAGWTWAPEVARRKSL